MRLTPITVNLGYLSPHCSESQKPHFRMLQVASAKDVLHTFLAQQLPVSCYNLRKWSVLFTVLTVSFFIFRLKEMVELRFQVNRQWCTKHGHTLPSCLSGAEDLQSTIKPHDIGNQCRTPEGLETPVGSTILYVGSFDLRIGVKALHQSSTSVRTVEQYRAYCKTMVVTDNC